MERSMRQRSLTPKKEKKVLSSNKVRSQTNKKSTANSICSLEESMIMPLFKNSKKEKVTFVKLSYSITLLNL
jgi:hypothetical protein